MALDLLNHLGSFKNFLAVHRKNNIALFHPRLFSRTFLSHLGDLYTAKFFTVFAAKNNPDYAAGLFDFACDGATNAAPRTLGQRRNRPPRPPPKCRDSRP